ncbi:hypothetical protein [Haliangium ochraceum]|uniref:Lipoprotein n=1 Tax=Haliangium ochraceum (strain DSM 14365 / JCM 11303 / SMP-2) TaxID=502025 RepID=D0LU19_HALO1|nr:hypothetical protein [Haliangium ochraceum]ACY17383.1 hypothetical protein Hoch_4894 [Haliangium ochraceum DSM 14365]
MFPQNLSPSLSRAAALAASLSALALSPACGSSAPPASPASSDTSQTAPEASAGPAPRIERGCLEAYAPCPATTGLPALSADGAVVAVADFGPDSARDERVLTVRLFDAASGQAVSELPVITWADYDQGADPMTMEFHADTEAAIEERVLAVERELARGRYRPLLALGTVHEQSGPQAAGGMVASFDGAALEIAEADSGAALLRHPLAELPAWEPSPEIECGPFPVAEIEVWASRAPRVFVAHVIYMGGDMCTSPMPFLILR